MIRLVKSITTTTAIAALTASAASAGTVLKLNSGAVDTTKISNNYAASWMMETQPTEYIVQFKKAITEADKAKLKAQFEVFGYLPEDALVVRSTYAKLLSFKNSHPEVQAVVKYSASYKVSSSFDVASVFNKDTVQSVLVKTFKASDADLVASKMAALNPKVELQVVDGNSVMALVPRGLVSQVAALTGVEHIQPTPEIESFHFVMDQDLAADVHATAAGDYSDLTGDEPGTRVMKFQAAWAQGFTGRNQIVSMADTGLDSGNVNAIHGDFAGNVISGYPFGLWSKTWDDPMGHGTHVAGSVMGNGKASGGLLKGGAYEAKMVAEGMWSPMLKNLSVPSKLGDLFAKAQTDGASIHTNSWGGARTFGAYDNFAVQVDTWLYDNPDMLVLFAAGNSGADKNKDGRIDANSMASPGTAKNVLTVGASENVVTTGGIQVPISKLRAAKDEWPSEPIYSDYISNNENGIAMFSSRGPTSDGRVKPDIVAPGTNILSVKSQQKDASELWGAYNKDYVWSGGTSMATPLTAGAAAVARQVLIEKLNIQKPSAALMKATMIHTAVDMYPGQFGEIGASRGQEILTRRPNSDEGYGRVDVQNIVNLGSKTQFIDNRQGVAQGQEVSYEFTLAREGKLYANLVWTDAPGSANAAQALVNDLDLVLTLPNGQTLSMNDHVNNLEMIEKSGLPAGSYKLTVKGFKVPQGKNGSQAYALVYTAAEL
ncbi:serine protease [Bdellovibrio bacteriovorus]|uniref:Serine protease n=1 Tax=Bdellovibrio bacteriovorus TaxID=959 RepID=A0A150WD07_BDEBC|nr:S8 family serine peptidase [Bdellovibrio bacteriovorus]KYG60866.1 serine protease [Bdellovibrio bacteriovorus]